ncbi:MYC/MYB transcription factor [Trema orientale]|uniref:MYC/MYB transcription factor n=1 Tax=Trema orientale TaxID=63057 RepID=A0A2P5FUA1_TREOI|nr:MYC/MYB transcription factor [Trema orientale]
MGYLLKEVLKTLCGWNQWSYAVFWKIGCQNPKLLIWEECHHEISNSPLPTRISGEGSTEQPLGEWERLLMSSETCSSQFGSQVEDRVSTLISKMMTSNPVKIVGEGIVGRAAFTGNHQWILSNSFAKYGHPPEVLNEMHHQFSAGMQTVAVVPVLPHGVIQLGSSLAIMENIGFVNDIKSLILQLGCVRGALLSDNYLVKDSAEKNGIPGLVLPMDPSVIHKMASSSYMVDSYSQPRYSFQASSLVGQLSPSLPKDIQNDQETTALTYEPVTMNPLPSSQGNPCQPSFSPLIKPISPFGGRLKDRVTGAEVISSSSSAWVNPCQPIFSPLIKPISPFGGQLKDRVTGAEVISSSSSAWLNQQASSYKGRSVLNNLCGFSQSGNKILSGVSIPNPSDDIKLVSNSVNTSQLRTSGSLLLDHNISSVNIPLSEGSQINGGINNSAGPVSVPCSLSNTHMAADVSLSGAHPAGIELGKAETIKTEEVSSSCVADQLIIRHTSKGFDSGQFSKDAKISGNGVAPDEQKIHSELFQALNIPFFHTSEHIFPSDHFPDFVHDCQNLDNTRFSGSANAKPEEQCTRPSSGDDLFDILGVDFKNKLLNCNGLDESMQGIHEVTSIFTSTKDSDSNLFSAKDGVADSGIFSGTATDHLLDAVVSRAHFSAKQISEDNLSCRTTLTKVSSSSVPSNSPTHGCVNLSNHMQGGKFELPKTLNKPGMVKTSSFKSGCSKDDAGNCSQTSGYGSQISSWVEQGSCMKHDSSVSTAYSKRPDEIDKSNRKRLKPGENPRPRPKDRQMIQDRVKELREIVPNGAKCSIDALLERTIKHMLFLQSVTKHADKLKQTGESKIINKEGGLLLKENFEGGATWAFEVGSQSMVCPIIVEDLNAPRQMLVEMLCEERGFFLEIADLIRGMGLTILKGVMEARNDKIWARFAIEANRDVTRMEIFMSLVQLLEQTVKGGALTANAIENNALMVHESIPQAVPIAATGRSGSLQ